MTMTRDERVEVLAEDLVAEALAELEGGLSEREREELYELVVAELIATEQGARLLRAMAPDPEVASSAEVAREPGEEPARRASGDDDDRGGAR